MEGYEIAYTVEVDENGELWDPDAPVQVVLHRTDILVAAVTADHFTESDDDSEADEGEREAHRLYVDYIVERMYDFMQMNSILYPEFETDSEDDSDE